ncbi:PAS domain S-box protein [Candidatus Sulfurimonas baltica]|uniref:histidine kinase n=1 Tax=Candidatus Sulfurimonas baltica TaxID=2740404 RepID=A0A7S7RMQ9_9BACT|nr:PAS domain S-box protein [Candidatus Sulfurimonas baltica]QOY51658.1 PAS domain S-box protein [Candidatus Sulfurimonas baltica]
MRVTTKLTALLLVAGLLPFISMTYINYKSSVKDITKEVTKNLSSSIKYRTKVMNRYAKNLKKSVELDSTSPLLNSILTDSDNFSKSLENKKSLQDFLAHQVKVHSLVNTFIISLSGDIIESAIPNIDFLTNLNDESCIDSELAKSFHKVLKERKSYISDFGYHKTSKKPSAFIISPIFSDSKIIGALGFQINIDELYSIIGDYDGLGETGEIIIASKVADKALFLNPLRNDPSAAFKRYVEIDSAYGLPIQQAVNSGNSSGIFYDYKHNEVIATWGYIPELRIGMVFKVDTKEAYDDIVKLKNSTILLGLIALSIYLYIVWLIRKMIYSLESKREQYEFGIMGTNDGLWDWNLKNNSIYFSPRWKEILGYKDDELTNEFSSWEEKIHPEDKQQALKDVEASLVKEGVGFKNTHRLKHKDGHWIWVLGRAKVLFDENGKASRMVGFETDITENKEKEEQIAKIGTLLTNIINSSDNLIFVKDENFKYIECNTAFEEFAEKTREEILGRSDYELFDKKIADFFRAKDEKVIKSNKSEYNHEWVTYPNGEKVYLLTVKTILHNEKGESAGLVGNSIDMTREHETQREIYKLKSTIERSPVSIVMTDEKGLIQYVNQNYSKVTGYSIKELIGQNLRIFKSGFTSDEEYAKMWRVINDGKVWSGDFKNVAKDGSFFWENTTIMPSFSEDGKVNGFIAIKLETTEKQYMQEALKSQEEIMIAQSRHAAMGEMISMIAHQWRQPISVIAMGANNILADIELDMVDINNLEIGAKGIIKQTQELSNTIDDFRHFFRPGKTLENILPQNILEDALGVIGKSLQNNNIEIIQEVHNAKEITTHSRELMQVLINILNNAKEALIESGVKEKKIFTLINDKKESLLIKICDNAGGIKEDIINKIFDPYFSTKEENVGTGLGLYMGKTIIEKHLGGTIEVINQSDTEGRVIGACFLIKLPYNRK